MSLALIYILNLTFQPRNAIRAIFSWLVVWNTFYFSIYWEFHHPNWRTHIFQRGWNHQPVSNIGYPLVNVYITNWKVTMLFMGKSTIKICICWDHLGSISPKYLMFSKDFPTRCGDAVIDPALNVDFPARWGCKRRDQAAVCDWLVVSNIWIIFNIFPFHLWDVIPTPLTRCPSFFKMLKQKTTKQIYLGESYG